VLQSIIDGKPAAAPVLMLFVVTISGGKESPGPDIRIAA
jgi:hypothetical protein